MMTATLLAIACAAAGPPAWPERGTSLWSVGGGGAASAAIAHSLPDRQFGVLRGVWAKAAGPGSEVAVEVIPLLVLRDHNDGTRVAAGFSLVGRGWLNAGLPWRYGVEFGAGALQFSGPVPKNAQSSNFTLQLGFAAERMLAPGRSLLLGCRIHHISNAHLSSVNPGINALHLYAELRFWRAAATVSAP